MLSHLAFSSRSVGADAFHQLWGHFRPCPSQGSHPTGARDAQGGGGEAGEIPVDESKGRDDDSAATAAELWF